MSDCRPSGAAIGAQWLINHAKDNGTNFARIMQRSRYQITRKMTTVTKAATQTVSTSQLLTLVRIDESSMHTCRAYSCTTLAHPHCITKRAGTPVQPSRLRPIMPAHSVTGHPCYGFTQVQKPAVLPASGPIKSMTDQDKIQQSSGDRNGTKKLDLTFRPDPVRMKLVRAQQHKHAGQPDTAAEEACLNFYKTKRSTRTMSETQVRKPIYQSSVKKWKNFEQELQPFRNSWKAGSSHS